MRPPLWQPSVDLSPLEQTILKRIKRAKLFVFLRQHRHTLFDTTFQDQLATIYQDAPLARGYARGAELGDVLDRLTERAAQQREGCGGDKRAIPRSSL